MNSASIDPRRPSFRNRVLAFLLVVLGVLLIGLAAGCSPRIIEHTTVQRDTVYKVRTDSVAYLQRDSVYIREKGDTVYIYKERLRYRDRVKIDTVRLVKVDSVTVERIKEVKVEKPLSLGQRLKLRLFWGLLAVAVCFGLWTFRKPLLKLIRL